MGLGILIGEVVQRLGRRPVSIMIGTGWKSGFDSWLLHKIYLSGNLIQVPWDNRIGTTIKCRPEMLKFLSVVERPLSHQTPSDGMEFTVWAQCGNGRYDKLLSRSGRLVADNVSERP